MGRAGRRGSSEMRSLPKPGRQSLKIRCRSACRSSWQEWSPPNQPRLASAGARSPLQRTCTRVASGVMDRAELLVVEDDPVIGGELRTALTSAGFAVRWVSTGADAVDAVSKQRPDLVLLDPGLPDVDG